MVGRVGRRLCFVFLGFVSVSAVDAPRSARAEAVPVAGSEAPAGSVGDTFPAPDGQPEPAGYRALVEEAIGEYDAGNFEEARSLFLQAHALFPNARTHRGIGKAEFELRNYPGSIAELEAALAATVRPLDASLRADAQQLLERARAFVGTVTIEVTPAPTDLLVDGVPAALPLTKPLILRVGSHVVEAHAPGYPPQRRRVTVGGGENLTVTMSFGAPPASAQTAEKRRGWYKSPWLWSALGGVVVGGVTAGVLATRGGSDRTATDAYVMTR